MRQTLPVPARARLATRSDVPRLGRALSAAFAADPIWRWLVPADAAWAATPPLFAHEVARRVPHGQAYTDDARGGVAVWVPPGGRLGRAQRVLRDLRDAPSAARVFRPGRIRDGLAVQAAMKAGTPREDHWYLAVLGVDPDHQGRGLGGTLIAPVLRRCDLDGVGAYLESSNERNVPFYRRHGFEAVDVVRPNGSPPMTLMWRDPRPVEGEDDR